MNRSSFLAKAALLAAVVPLAVAQAQVPPPRPGGLIVGADGNPVVDYLGMANWANSPTPRTVTTDIITPTVAGNATAGDRQYATDYPVGAGQSAPVLVVVPGAPLPAGTLRSFQTWNQAAAGLSPFPSAGNLFNAYVLRPTGVANQYAVVFDSGPLTVPALTGTASELASYPVAAFATQAGDVLAFYGQGVPLDVVGTGTDILSYPAPAAPTSGSTITLGVDPGFPIFPQARNYALAAVVDVVTGTTTQLVGGIRKFVDGLPGLTAAGANNLGQYLPVAIPDTASYPGSDYYEIELGEYSEKMHSDLPPTRLRGYRQVNTADATVGAFHYLGPVIVAQKERPVRIKFTNNLPTGAGGNLWIPVDESVMGAGTGPRNADGTDCDNTVEPNTCAKYTQNRATLHLHGGHTPWISDGTPHQWITPAGEVTPYKKGVSVFDVPDMPAQPDGSQTFYWTNQQSSRLMFYHDHAYGITRLNVYVGEAAGYVITDPVEQELIARGVLPAAADTVPLIIQDKTFVDADAVLATDPTWRWGTGTPRTGVPGYSPAMAVPAPVTGDLWYPHVYVPAQNPYDLSGANPFGRWHYGPWFWPPTTNILHGPVPNPYYDPNPASPTYAPWEAPEMPGVPHPSAPGESFFDVAVVNGTAYPTLTVDPKAVRLRILNAANDRFFNLQLYVAADKSSATAAGTTGAVLCDGVAAVPTSSCTEVKMVPAAVGAFTPPAGVVWPTDGREGGVPDPATMGPSFIQFATEGGFLPAPVVVPNQPILWNANPTTFNFGNVSNHGLLVAPAERADVVVDFSAYAGKTLILYNDAPAAFPALDPRYDYYTGNPDLRDSGGHQGTIAGYGPNTRTIMQIVVRPTTPAPAYDLAALQAAFTSTPGSNPPDGAFARAQDPIIVAQGDIEGRGTGHSAYDLAYGKTFPFTFPYWGVARIQDTSIAFAGVDGLTFNPPLVNGLPPPLLNGQVQGAKPMEPKALHDEMGAAYDLEYGRMSGKLGLEIRQTNAVNQTFILQNYADAPTEIISATPIASPTTDMGDAQFWKLTHNGVDTHPIHFHLFEVQLVNRVGWDGIIRLPDPNELGWKDTIRVSPLEDTIVALRFVAPRTPFGIPDSVRPMSPATPLNSPMGLSTIDPFTGQPMVPPPLNHLVNYSWEYVWHCHILSHEEMDMMRAVTVLTQRQLAPAPVLSPPALDAGGLLVVPAVLGWTDGTPADIATYNGANEVGFRVLRSENDLPFQVIGNALANQTTFTDTTAVPGGYYKYQVVAYNALGDSASNIQTVGQPVDVVPPTLTWGALAPAANARGWNGTPVSAAFTAADNLTGVASVTLAGNPAVSVTSPATIATEGLAQTVSLTVTDGAGNSATYTSPARNIDLTPPALTVAVSPPFRTRAGGTSGVTVSGRVTDALSGIVSGTTAGTYTMTDSKSATVVTGTFRIRADGTYSFSRNVSRANPTPGPRIYTFTIQASDVAGGVGTVTATYTIL